MGWRDCKLSMPKHRLALYLCGPIWIVVCVLFGVVYQIYVNDLLDQRAYVCGKDNVYYEPWKDSTKAGADLTRAFYFYNITNPYDVLNGDSFKLTEIGPFTYTYGAKKYNIDFSNKDGTVRYREHRFFHFSKKMSCDICDEETRINSINIAWQVMLVTARSEGVLAMNTLCTQLQILNMGSAVPVCTEAQRGDIAAFGCKCCAVTGGDPSSVCRNLVDPRNNTATGLMSFLAKLDGSHVVSYDTPAIPLITEIYSPAIQAITPRAIIGGRPSALMGLIQARQAKNGADEATLQTLAKFTKEYYGACKKYCPNAGNYLFFALTLSGITDEEARYQYIRDSGCHGTITAEDAVINNDLREYLVGMDCEAAYFTFLGGVFKLASQSDTQLVATCVDPAEDATGTCCYRDAAFKHVNDFAPAPGWGCIREVPGYTLTRRTSDTSEWDEANEEEYEEVTGCKDGDEDVAQDFVEFRSATASTTWYVPSGYTFPNMAHGEAYHVRRARLATPEAGDTGERIVTAVQGKAVPNRPPRGFSQSDFFDYQGTDGKLSGVKMDVFSRTMQIPTEFYFAKAVTMKGINVARMATDYQTLTAQTEENQRKGYGVPYQGIYAGLQYLLGAPVYMSYPHFYQCDPEAREQDDNSYLMSASTSGVELYSRVSEYKYGASALATEVPIDDEYMNKHRNLYKLTTLIDPFTGKTVGSTVTLLVSTTVWKCNPALDATCGFILYEGTDKCYSPAFAGLGSYSAGCSVTNVFSPDMLGGKVVSNFFVVEDSEMNDETAAVLHNAFTTRYVSHILLVVGTMIGLGMLGLGFYLRKRQDKQMLVSRSTMSPEIAIAMDSQLGKKSDAFDYRDDDQL